MAMASPPPHAIRKSPYAWSGRTGCGIRETDPSEEKDLVSRAVTARLTRLWLDTLNESPFGNLYFSAGNPAHDASTEERFRDLASHWEAVSRSGVQRADQLIPALSQWTSRSIPTDAFLLEAFKTVNQGSDTGLARIIQSYTFALRGDWWRAATTALSARTQHAATWNLRVALLASNDFLLAGAPGHCLHVLRSIQDPRYSLAVNTLKLVASARLRNRKRLAEASYLLGELGPDSEEQIERSAERRLARSRLGLHQAPAPYGAVPEFRGLELCRPARRLLLWA